MGYEKYTRWRDFAIRASITIPQWSLRSIGEQEKIRN